MKKLVSLLLALVMVLSCTAAFAQTATLGAFTFNVPDDWAPMSDDPSALAYLKDTNMLMFMAMSITDWPGMEELAPMLAALDDETIMTIFMMGITGSDSLESAPAINLASGEKVLLAKADMSSIDESMGNLFGVCPIAMTMKNGQMMMAFVANLGGTVSDATEAEFRTIISNTVIN